MHWWDWTLVLVFIVAVLFAAITWEQQRALARQARASRRRSA